MTTINLTLRLRVISHCMIVVLGLFFLAVPAWLLADTAQYYYDELGRLVGVVDGQGNAAVYNYDAVGNLLSIQRFTSSSGGVGLFLVTPGSSIVDKPVEIRGFGFTNPPSSNQVQFNGTAATVVSGSGVSLIVTVPAGATTGPVTVTNANGTATSPSAFTVLIPPIVTGIVPSKVAQGTSAQVVIEGFHLQAATAVQFSQPGFTVSIPSGATDTTLRINLTVASSVPPGPYAFSVTTPVGTAQSGTVKLQATPPLPGFSQSRVVTVQMVGTAVPATSAPSGSATATSPVTTVQMPVVTTVPSVSAPSGASFDVSPPASVSMP